MMTTTVMSRDETIHRIRTALKRRSGRAWSVRGGRGTAHGWIDVGPTPRRAADTATRDQDLAELAKLLDLDRVHAQGLQIPASDQYRREYVDRAEGRQPSVVGRPYWD